MGEDGVALEEAGSEWWGQNHLQHRHRHGQKVLGTENRDRIEHGQFSTLFSPEMHDSIRSDSV